MQKPESIKDKILTALLPEYAIKASQWDTVEKIQADSKHLVALLSGLTNLKVEIAGSDREPKEESKGPDAASGDIKKDILKLVAQYNETKKSTDASQVDKLSNLNKTRAEILQQIDSFKESEPSI